MISIRRLGQHEFGLLEAAPDGYRPDPSSSIAVAAVDGETLVGRMLVVPVAHVEGTWVAPGARGALVGRRLMAQIEIEAAKCGLRALMAYSTSGEHDSYLHRLGFERMPWTVWRRNI